jgi:hypothetical protein
MSRPFKLALELLQPMVEGITTRSPGPTWTFDPVG